MFCTLYAYAIDSAISPLEKEAYTGFIHLKEGIYQPLN